MRRQDQAADTNEKGNNQNYKTYEICSNLGVKLGLIILNSDYSNSSHSCLKGVSADGIMMEEMLTSYHEVHKNCIYLVSRAEFFRWR